MKTGVSQNNLFSNGKGDGSILNRMVLPIVGINMNTSGNLTLESEETSYSLTSKTVADNAWHHVTLLFNRIGSWDLCRC
jgi:hypothetical protein